MALLSAMVFVTAVVVAYSMLERRINHRMCPVCGFRVSRDALRDDCPRCNPVFDQEWQEPQRDDSFSSQRVFNRVPGNWPKVVFAGVPMAIIFLVGGLLISERLQSDPDKAIRLVKESNSRKENFSVQQYLFATVYHRRAQGEPMTIEGWRAEPSHSSAPIKVEFIYTDATGQHAPEWRVSLTEGTVTPGNEPASNLTGR